MLLIYMADDAMSESDREHCYAESTQLARDLRVDGKFLGANPLHPTSTATSVRIRDCKPLVTDGPFAETREHLGGYFLITPRTSTRRSASRSGFPGRASARSKSGR
jgi:hypothetical protein